MRSWPSSAASRSLSTIATTTSCECPKGTNPSASYSGTSSVPSLNSTSASTLSAKRPSSRSSRPSQTKSLMTTRERWPSDVPRAEAGPNFTLSATPATPHQMDPPCKPSSCKMNDASHTFHCRGGAKNQVTPVYRDIFNGTQSLAATETSPLKGRPSNVAPVDAKTVFYKM